MKKFLKYNIFDNRPMTRPHNSFPGVWVKSYVETESLKEIEIFYSNYRIDVLNVPPMSSKTTMRWPMQSFSRDSYEILIECNRRV